MLRVWGHQEVALPSIVEPRLFLSPDNTTANTDGSREEVGWPKRQGLGDMDTTTIPEMGSLLRHAEERNTGQGNNLNDQGSPQGKSSTSSISQPRRRRRPPGSKNKKSKTNT